MIGTCKYCGQRMMTDYENEELANYEAEMNCKCQEGMEHRNIEEMKVEAHSNVNTLFENDPEEARAIMVSAIDAIAVGAVKRVSIKINERVNAEIAAGKDSIKVTRSYKEANVLEASKF